MLGCTRNRALLSLLTRNETIWPASSKAKGAGPAGYGRMFVAQLGTVWAGEFSGTIWFGPPVKLGGSLTGRTVMMKICGALVSLPPLAMPPSSMRTTVTIAEPLALGAAV